MRRIGGSDVVEDGKGDMKTDTAVDEGDRETQILVQSSNMSLCTRWGVEATTRMPKKTWNQWKMTVSAFLLTSYLPEIRERLNCIQGGTLHTFHQAARFKHLAVRLALPVLLPARAVTLEP
jgi:hypothetical protein